MIDKVYNYFALKGIYGAPAFTGVVLALICFYLLGIVLYNLFFHPLAAFPGPRICAATRLWYTASLLRGQLPFDTHRLHEKYGPVVRIAPDELSYTGAEPWKEIYGHRSGKPEMEKDQRFYANISSGPNSVIRADRQRHGHIRRLLAHGFSDKALREQEREIQFYAGLLMQRLRENCGKGDEPVDMVMWYNYFTFDLIGDLAFGESFECLESSSYHPWVSMIFDNVKISAWLRSTQHYPMIQRALLPLIPKNLTARRQEHRELSEIKARRRMAMKTDRTDFLGRMAEEDSGASLREFIETASTLIIAGSETTATLLSGVTYYLLMNPRVLDKLVKEIRSSFNSEDDINLIKINDLKYLIAVLEEGLRIYPPVPGGFPRRVPPGGDTIDGVWVPENTIVYVSHFATYRSARYFNQPDEFVPERWLGDPRFETDNKAALQPFAIGPRNCLGKNLAYLEMKLILARLLWNFDLEMAKGSEDWANQGVFLLWQKDPLYAKLTPVVR